MIWQSENVRSAIRYAYKAQRQQSQRLSTPKSQRSKYLGGPQIDDFNSSLIVTGMGSQSTRNSATANRQLRNSSQQAIDRAVTNTKKRRQFLSQHVSPDRSAVATPILLTEKNLSTAKKAEQEVVAKNQSEEGDKESPEKA